MLIVYSNKSLTFLTLDLKWHAYEYHRSGGSGAKATNCGVQGQITTKPKIGQS